MAALMLVKPWGTFGWDEWVVLAAPLLFMISGVGRVHVLFTGMAFTSAVWIMQGAHWGGAEELICVWALLLLGTEVGFSVNHRGDGSQLFPAAGVSHLNEELFFESLSRELCRARRDGSSFAVLSVDAWHESAELELHAICDVLGDELRAYSDIAEVGNRVLVLVPEVEDGQHKPMLRRIRERALQSPCGDMRIGMARFPQDAVCGKDLIDVADRKRHVQEVMPHIPSADDSVRELGS